MKTNKVRCQPLTIPQVVLIFIISLHLCGLNNNMKPNPLRTAEPCKELHKTKEEKQIFLVFSIFQRKHTKQKQTKQNLFGFFLRQTKPKKTKKQTKRNNKNIFGLFVFWESRNKNQKESETWIYKEPTKHDI